MEKSRDAAAAVWSADNDHVSLLVQEKPKNKWKILIVRICKNPCIKPTSEPQVKTTGQRFKCQTNEKNG